MARLNRNFYRRDAVSLAQNLLGKVLVRQTPSGIISGRIVETEAYVGEEDLASHARFGRTNRNQIMYDHPGLVYIYLVYGMYYNFNIVASYPDVPEAVLVRSLEAIEGEELAIENLKKFGRVRSDKNIMSGPGKLCVALDLTGDLYGEDLVKSNQIYVTDDILENIEIESGPRVGIDYAGEYRDKPLRFWIKGNKFVSK